MSQKNFASYGDMETLVTEIADKCGPYTEISYDDWLQLTPYQQEHGRWDVTDVPGADGTISIDLMTKLWENPNPTQSIAANTEFNINTASYDLVMFVFAYTASYLQYKKSVVIPQGSSTILAYTNLNGDLQSVRGFDYISDTKYKAAAGYLNETINDAAAIPLVAYGIKLHHTVEIKAIAPTVSTLAEKCVFDPTGTDLESTDVEAAIKELESNFQAGVDDIYDAVVAKGSTPASHSLSDVVQGIEDIETGITPSGTLSITTNGTKDVTNYKTVSVSVPNTVSAAVVAYADNKAMSEAYSFTRTSGYAYMVAVHADGGTVGAYGIINSAGSIQSWAGSTDYFSLTRNSATSFTLKKTSGSDRWTLFIFRAL